MRARVAAIVIALAACKDKKAAAPLPSPAPRAIPAEAPRDAALPPHLDRSPAPTPAKQSLGAPLSIDDAKQALPAIDGKEILALRQTSDKRQVHATWCLDGESADDVARSVGRQLAAAKYTDIAIRGDAKKSGVQGLRDGFQLSMIVSGSSAATCPAPKHYFASATIFRAP